jgi:hypothetical protein
VEGTGEGARYCRNCGKPLAVTDKFCEACGAATEGGPLAPSAGPATSSTAGRSPRLLIVLAALIALAVVGGVLALTIGGEDGDENPTSVTEADLDKDGAFWNRLTPDLKEQLINMGKAKLGVERPDATSLLAAVDNEKLIGEVDQEYANEAKRLESIYATYVKANDELAREDFQELLPQLEEEGSAP